MIKQTLEQIRLLVEAILAFLMKILEFFFGKIFSGCGRNSDNPTSQPQQKTEKKWKARELTDRELDEVHNNKSRQSTLIKSYINAVVKDKKMYPNLLSQLNPDLKTKIDSYSNQDVHDFLASKTSETIFKLLKKDCLFREIDDKIREREENKENEENEEEPRATPQIKM